MWQVQTGDLEYNDSVIMRGSTASTLAYRLCKRAFAFLYCYQSLPVDEVRKATAAWENDEALHRPGKCRARISYIKNKRPFLTREGTAVHGGRGLDRCAGRRGTTVRCAAGRQRGWEYLLLESAITMGSWTARLSASGRWNRFSSCSRNTQNYKVVHPSFFGTRERQ
jgi:hypothetical protein